ncbi:UDP-glucoronosyl and UDP-glucosyl transferase [Trichostrongylus colubriformis]|uniref:glucuronosyltransferase n=1 Tax=Trichostrongylus colubriformis TaxID=6319 RepID=A0AAN8IQF4_TRICO
MFTYLSWYFQTGIASAADRVMRNKLGPTVTPIWDIVANISWVLVNSEPLMEFDAPTLRKVVSIGGLGVTRPKPLSDDWDRILNLREQTVLISFGTVALSKNMPESMKQAIIKVIKSYPKITFIWKYEDPDDVMFKGIENVIPSKWTPQSCLLADKRLTIFITHGGVGSMMESALRAKPLVVVPLFGDQTRNAKLIEKFGFGILVEKARLLNSNVLRSAIDRILTDPKYRIAANRISRLLSRRPFSPEEKLVKTVELAAEFGNLAESKVAGRNLGIIAYYNLDLLFVLTAVFSAFTGLVLYAVLRLFRRYFVAMKVKIQ